MTSVAETSGYILESFNLISPPTRGARKLEPSLFLRRLTNLTRAETGWRFAIWYAYSFSLPRRKLN
ncbi:hypothetical protein BGAL_0862g00030 [Botrytis galanthina]|uniref:Uncharacterized protein n=1 Tax=Botrytis galanthina TaxID=278940 RepID=A0A4S8QHD8_9HELO|nr:hypothetical protein BGAL_0862g00030 [Botrytis galanthina]